jgi:hypothetical protein
MALDRFVLPPGIDRDASQTAGEGRWWGSNRVRFAGSWPEKIGGWIRRSATLLDGRVRALLSYTLLAGDPIVGMGSNERLYIEKGATVTDVTPVDRTRSLSAGVATVATTTLVTFTFTASHGAAPGDIFTFDVISGTSRTPSAVVVGGVPLAGDWRVLALISGTQLTALAGAAAASTVPAGGGALTATFFLPTGRADDVPLGGYGAGPYSAGGWSTPRPIGAIQPARFWSLDAWGEIMLASPSQGGLFSLTIPSGVVSQRAVLVVNGTAADGPPLAIGSMVVTPSRQALLLGASDLNSASNFDPMLLRYSDIEDFSLYRAAADNAAGSIRLQGGSELRGAFNTQLQTLVWSDTSLFGLRFIGQPLIWRADLLGRQCGLIGPKSFTELNGAVYWMSKGAFWMYRGGSPEQMPCPLWDDVFGDLNVSAQRKVACGSNGLHGEVTWFYPSRSSTEPDRYVSYDTGRRIWYGGALSRTAWLDRGVLTVPIAADFNSQLIYEHETGVDADGVPMGEWIESGYFDIADGEQFTLLSRLIPDFARLSGAVSFTLRVQDYPLGPTRLRGPYVVRAGTERISPRARGRQVAVRIDGDAAAGGDWRLGALRVQAQPDGTR